MNAISQQAQTVLIIDTLIDNPEIVAAKLILSLGARAAADYALERHTSAHKASNRHDELFWIGVEQTVCRLVAEESISAGYLRRRPGSV